MDFSSLKKFSSRACYGVVVVAKKQRDKHSGGPATPNVTTDGEKQPLSKLITSAIDNVTPRGLNSLWKVVSTSDGGLFRSSIDTRADNQRQGSSNFDHYAYFWAGRRSSQELRAYAMSQVARLCRSLQDGDDVTLEMLHRSGNRLLSDVVSFDTNFEEFEQAVHLVRRRFNIGDPSPVSPSRNQLRDVRYSLFGRSELEASKRKQRSSGEIIESTIARSVERGDSDSDSEDDDDDSSSSSDSESVSDHEEPATPRGRSPRMKKSARETIVEPVVVEGDEFSGGILSEFNPNDDGGPEPDPNEATPADDAGHGERIRFFDVRLSEITPNIFLGSATGARKRKWLQARGITHIVNCASMILKNWWPDDFQYLSLYLLDGKREDVLCLAYDVLEWIDNAVSNGKKVFVHCQQGVSRSTTVVEMYLMWKWKMSYRDTHNKVKSCRNVASPNPGFIVQLLMWEKKMFTPVIKPNLLLMAPQSTYDPEFIVPKRTTIINPMTLMTNEVYILHSMERLWIWIGKSSPESHHKAAQRVAPLMIKFENAPKNLITIKEGEEPANFWSDLYGDSGATTPSTNAPVTASAATPPSAARTPSEAVKRGNVASLPSGIPPIKRIPSLGLVTAQLDKSGSSEPKRPASPVKLKLNLGTISAQKPMELNLSALQKKPVTPVMAQPSPDSSSSSASESETSSSSDGEDHGSSSQNKSRARGDDDDSSSYSSESESEEVPEPDQQTSSMKRGSLNNNTKLRLADVSRSDLGPASPSGPLSPLSSPSLRHRLGLPMSPKPHVVVTLEQARRALEASLPEDSPPVGPPVKRASPERTASPSPEKRPSPSSSSNTSPITVHLSPRVELEKPIPKVNIETGCPSISSVLGYLFLGNDASVDEEAAITRLDISAILNVTGSSTKAAQKTLAAKTKTFFCDGDVLCLLFSVLPRIQEAKSQSKRILIQGSADVAPAFAVAYLMWEFHQRFVVAERAVRDCCPWVSPITDALKNQLEMWEERLAGLFLTSNIRVYHVTKQSAKAPTLLVPKMLTTTAKSVLKAGEVFIIHSETSFFIWIGRQQKYTTEVAAKKIVAQMAEYERISTTPVTLVQGKETGPFWKLFSN